MAESSDDDPPATVRARPRTSPDTSAYVPLDQDSELDSDAQSPPEDFVETLAPGTRAGRYVLLQRLGAGGAGLVYAAFDPELDRKVAIKILRAADGSGSAADHGRARLLREGQAMARLKHPNVLPVYDVGTMLTDGHERVFMAMELVDGGTLRAWLRARPRTRREIVAVLCAAGRGLAAAHAAGMVHRDFKPENVLVDGDGRVFVTDFGLVRTNETTPAEPSPERTQPAALDTPLTREGTIMGTPAYMAPEQHRAEAADVRTDQFSFCVTLYEALYGKRPFDGANPMELRAAILAGRRAPPPTGRRVPRRLERLILRGLEADRSARHPSMEALLAALERDPRAPLKRALVAAGVLAAVGVVGWSVQRTVVERRQLCRGGARELDGIWDGAARERVQQAFVRAGVGELPSRAVTAALDAYASEWASQHREACEATRIRGAQPESVLGLRMSCLDARKKELSALASLLSEADRTVAFGAAESASKLTSVRSCGDVAALTARIPPPTEPATRRAVEELQARLVEGKVLEDAAKYPAARRIVDEVLGAEALLRYGPLRADALQLRARLEREQDGKMDASETSLVEAITAAYASHDDARAAAAMTDLAFLEAYWLGKHEDGERWVRLAQAAITRLGGSDELEAERARVEAEIWIGQDKGVPAVAAAEPALRLAEKLWGPVSLRGAAFHATLGAAYATRGDEEGARRHYQRQHAILEQLVGPDHPLVAMALNNLGLSAEARGQLDEAERDYRRSVALLERALEPDHPRVAIALANLGATLRKRGKPAEALAAFERALAINQKRFGDGYADSLDALLGSGEALVALGRPREALPRIERALRIAESGEHNAWGAAEARFALAQALWDAGGDRARARRLASEARAGMAAETNVIARRQLGEIDAWLRARR